MPQERGIEKEGKKVSIKGGGEHRDKARRRATVETKGVAKYFSEEEGTFGVT